MQYKKAKDKEKFLRGNESNIIIHEAYTDEFKQQLVNLYHSGKRRCDICREYDIGVSI